MKERQNEQVFKFQFNSIRFILSQQVLAILNSFIHSFILYSTRQADPNIVGDMNRVVDVRRTNAKSVGSEERGASTALPGEMAG